MGLPRQRKTKSASRQHRSHDALKKVQAARCKNCNSPVMPHVVCEVCGFYRGIKVKEIALKK